MNKLKKKNAMNITLIIIALLLIIAIAFTIWHIYSLPQNNYSRRWQLDMPKHLKVVEDIDSVDFSGKGIRFTYFSTKATDKPDNFNTEKNVQLEENFKSLINELKSELDLIGRENDGPTYQANWENPYYWYADGDGIKTIIIIFFYSNKQLLVCEKIGDK